MGAMSETIVRIAARHRRFFFHLAGGSRKLPYLEMDVGDFRVS